MPTPVINVADVDLVPRPAEHQPPGASAELYGLRMGRIGNLVGAQKLGYNVTAVPPGKRAFPFHSHRVNEEMFFVLEGTGAAALQPSRARNAFARLLGRRIAVSGSHGIPIRPTTSRIAPAAAAAPAPAAPRPPGDLACIARGERLSIKATTACSFLMTMVLHVAE